MQLISESNSYIGSARGVAARLGPEIELKILHLLAKAYMLWKRDGFPKADHREVSLTTALIAKFRVASRSADAPFEAYMEQVQLTDDMLSGKVPPDEAVRIDVVIQWSHYIEDDSYVIECKRLDQSYHPRRYVSNGIKRFAAQSYAHGSSMAGMIGFAPEGDGSIAVGKVNHVIKHSHEFSVSDTLRHSRANLGIPHVYNSTHTRAGSGRTIQITHLILEVRVP
jgi:hypothetical protein